jgi:hypothetical protein
VGVTFDRAKLFLEEATSLLFRSDARVQAVGINRHGGEFGYWVLVRTDLPPPPDARPLADVREVPVSYAQTTI